MMHLADILILAITKLRTRYIRTGITVVVSGLLFGCLVATLFIAEGTFHSIDQFNTQGFGSRFIVQAKADPSVGSITQNKDIQARALEIYNQLITNKKAAAKRLGLTYDSTIDRPPVISPDGQATDTFLDTSTPAAQQAVNEYMQAHPLPNMVDLQHIATPYHPKDLFTTTILAPGKGAITTMEKGVENFSSNQPDIGTRYQTDILLKYPLQTAPTAITQPFMLAGTSHSVSHPDAIPIIVSYSTAEQILGMSALPKGAPAAQKLARIRRLYSTAQSGTFSACYRNDASSQEIQDAITTAADIAKNANNKDYQKPELIYGLPAANSCGAATVLRDVRTAGEKSQAAKQKQFDAMFGVAVEPDQQKVEFRIVGLTPDAQNGAPSNSAAGILQGLVQSSLSDVITVPQSMYDTLPSAVRYKAIFDAQGSITFSNPVTEYAEFTNDIDARNFINNRSCVQTNSGCSSTSKPFTLSAFGSNSIALHDLQRKFSRFFELATLAIILIAIVTMTGTIGRMIADSRRETAVFRAVGADRLDIASVYTLYVVMLSLLVAIFALVLGILIARGIDWYYWQMATVQAQLAFGGSNLSLQFHLFQPNVKVFWVLLATVGAGLASIVLPLVRNIRRSPIKDMRDE
ncbi:MAG: ABC transporter permease [Candidatus Saccharibacteria bacterium]